MKSFKQVIAVFLFIFSVLGSLFLNLRYANAQASVESDNFRIQLPGLNSGAGIPSSTNYRLDSTIGQTAPGLYSSTGYRVKAGFQYLHSIIPFSFTISDISINFGTLTVQTPSTDTNTLKVSSGGAGGYKVTAQENHPLQNTQSITIPDTTCDAGTCSESSANVWSLNTTYGFGFNMSGDDIPSDFVDSTYFRQFADASIPEGPQTVMSSSNVGKSRESTVTYKANISGTQASGIYRNIITYIATPTY